VILSERLFENELMDDPSAPEEEVQRALGELDVINATLGGSATTAKGLQKLSRSLPPGPLTLLDIGAGGSRWLTSVNHVGSRLLVSTLDSSETICRLRRAKDPLEPVFCGDARTFPFEDSSFDIVHASLFLHHFSDNDVRMLLEKFLRVSRYGMIVNDLHRSGLAWMGISILTRLFSRSDLVRNDGPLSVRRGFTRSELVRLCAGLPASSVSIEWSWAFRWLIVISK
jgi:ubiquinone/menaquinone biosynthesis C-methylase UbiE